MEVEYSLKNDIIYDIAGNDLSNIVILDDSPIDSDEKYYLSNILEEAIQEPPEDGKKKCYICKKTIKQVVGKETEETHKKCLALKNKIETVRNLLQELQLKLFCLKNSI